MTCGTGHLCFIMRQVRRAQYIFLFLNMTPEAYIPFRSIIQKSLFGDVIHNTMAVSTTQVPPMNVSFPVVEPPFFVTIETNGILFSPCIERLWTKRDYIHVVFRFFNMEASGSVTCFTICFLNSSCL